MAGGGTAGEGVREADFLLSREPETRLYPRTWRSQPEPKADTQVPLTAVLWCNTNPYKTTFLKYWFLAEIISWRSYTKEKYAMLVFSCVLVKLLVVFNYLIWNPRISWNTSVSFEERVDVFNLWLSYLYPRGDWNFTGSFKIF